MQRNRKVYKVDKKHEKRNENIYENKTKRINFSGILMALIVLALLVFCAIFAYQKFVPEEEVIVWAELEEATLPEVAFIEEGYQVNVLSGYTEEMNILTMRDTISPLTPQGKLTLVLLPYENEITEVSYQVYSGDGTLVLKEETITSWDDDQLTLNLSSVIPDVEESYLKLQLTLADGRVVYYYTRLITYGNSNLSTNLDFVNTFHEAILYDTGTVDIYSYLSSIETTSNGTLQYVTKASSLSDVTWGSMEPTLASEVSINITECSSLFVSVLLEYQVEATNEDTGVIELYNVEEFFRVGYSSSDNAVQLKQYARTINQVLDVESVEITEAGIVLGITADSTSYKMNTEETAIAFVQERALYLYHGETSEILEIISLEDQESSDSRYQNYDYNINILSVEENGSVSFVLYGYINRGSNEGKVGTSVYYYDAETNVLVEKAFVAVDSSFAVGEEDMSQGMYYSSSQNILYLIAQEAFYEVNLTDNTQDKLSENMEEGSYVITEDGKCMAYIVESECVILEFETGESYTISDTSGDKIMPLGFIGHDLIYGVYDEADQGIDEAESEMTPMYKLAICSQLGEILKVYETDNQYIRDISIRDNMITMNLVEIQDDIYVYTGQDIITNNEAEVSENVAIEYYTTEQKQEQALLAFDFSVSSEQDVVVMEPFMAISEDAIYISYEENQEEVMYYAYAYGKLQLQSTMASEAIQYASENVGAVVSTGLSYIWRSGSRDLTYTISNYSDYASRISGGESAIEIVAEAANQQVVFYTGCTTEQMCYIINQGEVIAAKLESDEWILLIGYSGDTMYYLNTNGVKSSITMDSLDVKVIELVGDGL